MKNNILTFIKKYWIYIFVLLFCVKCTQNCSNKNIIYMLQKEITTKDSILIDRHNKHIQDSIIIYNQNLKILSLEESLKLFNKAYDVQLKQQDNNTESQKIVFNILQKVDKIDKNLKQQESKLNETK